MIQMQTKASRTTVSAEDAKSPDLVLVRQLALVPIPLKLEMEAHAETLRFRSYPACLSSSQ